MDVDKDNVIQPDIIVKDDDDSVRFPYDYSVSGRQFLNMRGLKTHRRTHDTKKHIFQCTFINGKQGLKKSKSRLHQISKHPTRKKHQLCRHQLLKDSLDRTTKQMRELMAIVINMKEQVRQLMDRVDALEQMTYIKAPAA